MRAPNVSKFFSKKKPDHSHFSSLYRFSVALEGSLNDLVGVEKINLAVSGTKDAKREIHKMCQYKRGKIEHNPGHRRIAVKIRSKNYMIKKKGGKGERQNCCHDIYIL